MKIIIILLMFFILGSLLIISNNNLNFQTADSFDRFKNIWTEWLHKVFLNFREITGNAVKLDWNP